MIMAQDKKQSHTIYPNYQNEEPVVKKKKKKNLKRGHKKKATKKKVSQVVVIDNPHGGRDVPSLIPTPLVQPAVKNLY